MHLRYVCTEELPAILNAREESLRSWVLQRLEEARTVRDRPATPITPLTPRRPTFPLTPSPREYVEDGNPAQVLEC